MAAEFRDRDCQFVFVYTREAHPSDRYPGHDSFEQKLDHARTMAEKLGFERPMLVDKLSEHDIPYIAFKYAENSGQMQPIREQAGTFADSIKLWS